MPRLEKKPKHRVKDQIFDADISEREKAFISRSVVRKLQRYGNISDCIEIVCNGGKIRFFVRPSQDANERLRHYRKIYADAHFA